MATEPTDFLMSLKEQCNLLDDEDDALVARICAAAVAHTASDLGFALDDVSEFPDGIPEDVRQAILMLGAHWYENREQTLIGVTAQSVPFGYEAIIANHRSYTYG